MCLLRRVFMYKNVLIYMDVYIFMCFYVCIMFVFLISIRGGPFGSSHSSVSTYMSLFAYVNTYFEMHIHGYVLIRIDVYIC
jgi:hypothetical protein